MTTVDVVVVGGGPAGSSCAGALVSAGYEVVVLDHAAFPRDKVCAGWITPDVVRLLGLDLAAYGSRCVLEPFTAFRVSLGTRPPVLVDYGRVVSYGIRRVEFDHVLLQRAAPAVVAQERVTALEAAGGKWVVNGRWTARFLVGAGGHRCPVARVLNPGRPRETVVVAQRAEAVVPVTGLRPGTPELFFEDDLQGYGWLLPKGGWVNVGLGREDTSALPARVRAFGQQLSDGGRLTGALALDWAGHAYVLASASRRTVVGQHALLVGDAAGLAAPASGEGIRAAVVSGRMAAEAIRRLDRDGDRTALAGYADALRTSLGHGRGRAAWSSAMRWRPLIHAAFRSRAFTRHVLLDRVFLHGVGP